MSLYGEVCSIEAKFHNSYIAAKRNSEEAKEKSEKISNALSWLKRLRTSEEYKECYEFIDKAQKEIYESEGFCYQYKNGQTRIPEEMNEKAYAIAEKYDGVEAVCSLDLDGDYIDFRFIPPNNPFLYFWRLSTSCTRIEFEEKEFDDYENEMQEKLEKLERDIISDEELERIFEYENEKLKRGIMQLASKIESGRY